MTDKQMPDDNLPKTAKLDMDIVLDCLAQAARGEALDQEACETIESIAKSWGADFTEDDIRALYDCGPRTDLAPSTTDDQKTLGARVAALEKHSHVPVDFTPYIRRIEALEISIASPPCVDVNVIDINDARFAKLIEYAENCDISHDPLVVDLIEAVKTKRNLRTSDAGGEQSCQYCGGQGYTIGTEPDCCGDFMETGECKSYCCVPKEVQEQCSGCYGSGKAPTPPTDEQRALDALNRIKRRLCRRLKLEEYDSTDFIIVEQFLTRDQRSDDG